MKSVIEELTGMFVGPADGLNDIPFNFKLSRDTLFLGHSGAVLVSDNN